MIKQILYRNFKVLRNTTLHLGQFTLLVGPNGSGKTTVLEVFQCLPTWGTTDLGRFVSVGDDDIEPPIIQVDLHWDSPENDVTIFQWPSKQVFTEKRHCTPPYPKKSGAYGPLKEKLSSIRSYSFNARVIASAVELQPDVELGSDGNNLVCVLDQLRDQHPERFEALNSEFARWIPEFDRILFETPEPGHRAFLLRTRAGHHSIPAYNLSQGTLLALAIVTLSYLPSPPSLVCLEEPDHGIHPRLLRDIRDSLYRLSHPDSTCERRKPVQVIVTTHSPYMLDLYRDHPEEVVIAQKDPAAGASFERLSNLSDIEEILKDTNLGEVWYSGILGGVPQET